MNEDSHFDIRKLLKNFGIAADEAVSAHLEQLAAGDSPVRLLKLRLRLEDLTDYGGNPPDAQLSLEVEGEVRVA